MTKYTFKKFFSSQSKLVQWKRKGLPLAGTKYYNASVTWSKFILGSKADHEGHLKQKKWIIYPWISIAISFVLCPSALGSSRNFNNSKLVCCWPLLALLQCICLKHGYLVLLTIAISIVQVVIPIMKRIPSFWTNAHMCALLEISLSTKVKLFKVKSPCQCFILL